MAAPAPVLHGLLLVWIEVLVPPGRFRMAPADPAGPRLAGFLARDVHSARTGHHPAAQRALLLHGALLAVRTGRAAFPDRGVRDPDREFDADPGGRRAAHG